jgi:Protein of unknown function (DUF3499)
MPSRRVITGRPRLTWAVAATIEHARTWKTRRRRPAGAGSWPSDLRFSSWRGRGPKTLFVKLLFRQGPFSPGPACGIWPTSSPLVVGQASCDRGHTDAISRYWPHFRAGWRVIVTAPGLVYPSKPMNSGNCSRPACVGKPAAWLAYDYGSRCAWIDDEVGGQADRSSRWPLCERHADNLRVPRGWQCVDRRASTHRAESFFDAGPGTGDGGHREFEGESVGAGASDRDTNFRMSQVSSRIR